MQYFFNGHLRWNLGFETPNQGGAWIAILLPWLWGLTFFAWGRGLVSTGCRRWAWRLLTVFFVATECMATWALVKTYSRGALVGALAALGLAAGLSLWTFWNSHRPQRLAEGGAILSGACGRSLVCRIAPWLGRSALLVVLLGVSDFDRRLAPDYAATDRSVTNRVDLWKGGLELIAISPLRGWGWGNSGASFMHWTQPIGRSEAYKSMVNSYLTVGVEGGLPVLAVVLTISSFALLLGIHGIVTGGNRKRLSCLCLAAPSSWLAWLVCLLFSNLWITAWLWVVPALTFGWLVWAGRGLLKSRQGGWQALGCMGLSMTLCLGLWLVGARFASALPVKITRSAGGAVTLATRHASTDTLRLVVLPDAQVLGEAYGQELRRWVVASRTPLRLRVIASIASPLPAGETVVAFGAACSDARLDGRMAVRIHPTQGPDDKAVVVKGGILQLSGIDVAQKNVEWGQWAAERGVITGQSWGLATDVRAQWPELVLGMQSRFKNQ